MQVLFLPICEPQFMKWKMSFSNCIAFCSEDIYDYITNSLKNHQIYRLLGLQFLGKISQSKKTKNEKEIK